MICYCGCKLEYDIDKKCFRCASCRKEFAAETPRTVKKGKGNTMIGISQDTFSQILHYFKMQSFVRTVYGESAATTKTKYISILTGGGSQYTIRVSDHDRRGFYYSSFFTAVNRNRNKGTFDIELSKASDITYSGLIHHIENIGNTILAWERKITY